MRGSSLLWLLFAAVWLAACIVESVTLPGACRLNPSPWLRVDGLGGGSGGGATHVSISKEYTALGLKPCNGVYEYAGQVLLFMPILKFFYGTPTSEPMTGERIIPFFIGQASDPSCDGLKTRYDLHRTETSAVVLAGSGFDCVYYRAQPCQAPCDETDSYITKRLTRSKGIERGWYAVNTEPKPPANCATLCPCGQDPAFDTDANNQTPQDCRVNNETWRNWQGLFNRWFELQPNEQKAIIEKYVALTERPSLKVTKAPPAAGAAPVKARDNTDPAIGAAVKAEASKLKALDMEAQGEISKVWSATPKRQPNPQTPKPAVLERVMTQIYNPRAVVAPMPTGVKPPGVAVAPTAGNAALNPV